MKLIVESWLLPVGLATPIVIAWLYAVGVFLEMTGGENWAFGYYGRFNRVKKEIETIPSVRIVDSWQHHDATMEDFSFTVVGTSGTLVKIAFREGSPQMALSYATDIRAFLQQQLSQ